MKNKLMTDTVTLYHFIGTDAQSRDVYNRYLLKNVHFERRESVLPVKSGFQPYNSFKLYVDIQNKRNGLIYADKFAFDALTSSAKAKCWTVAEGDFLTFGETNYVLPTETVDGVKSKCEAFTVNTVNPYKLGKKYMLEISGRGRVID